MALIKCPECGKEISDRAARCPKCGIPMEKILFLLQQSENDTVSKVTEDNNTQVQQEKDNSIVLDNKLTNTHEKGINWKRIILVIIIILLLWEIVYLLRMP